ncbi:MAG: hypothetical protein U0793_05870 [Gemmataceae bacterium]
MKTASVFSLLVLVPCATQAQETTDWVAAKAAAREIDRQLDFMDSALATIPGPPAVAVHAVLAVWSGALSCRCGEVDRYQY